MNINIKDYEKVLFSEKTTNRSITKYGWKVGDHLVVSHIAPHKFSYHYRDNQYRIYRLNDGLSVLDTTFYKEEDAIRFAEWLNGIYEEYFFLWTEYPHAEIFRWTYLTVENGEEYWAYLKDLENKRSISWIEYNR